MLALAEAADGQNLKVGVGLMCRHCDARRELFDRIRGGQIGDLVLLRAYRMAGPTGTAFVGPKPDNISELLYQIRNFHGFLWASGGAFSDFLIHNIDECCWMKDAWPVSAKAQGGRHYRGNYVDQNFDNYGASTRSATAPSCSWKAARWPAASRNSPAIATAPRARPSSRIRAIRLAAAGLFRGQNFQQRRYGLALRQQRAGPLSAGMEPPADRHSPEPALQRGQARGGGQPDHRHGPHGLPHGTGRHAATRCSTTRRSLRPRSIGWRSMSPAPVRLGPDNKYPVPQPGIVTGREY